MLAMACEREDKSLDMPTSCSVGVRSDGATELGFGKGVRFSVGTALVPTFIAPALTPAALASVLRVLCSLEGGGSDCTTSFGLSVPKDVVQIAQRPSACPL